MICFLTARNFDCGTKRPLGLNGVREALGQEHSPLVRESSVGRWAYPARCGIGGSSAATSTDATPGTLRATDSTSEFQGDTRPGPLSVTTPVRQLTSTGASPTFGCANKAARTCWASAVSQTACRCSLQAAFSIWRVSSVTH